MNKRLPPFSALRAFEALARLGRVNAVAKELHLTHSAISHQIKNLEALVGVALFHREARTMSLTDAGRTYAYQVRHILDELSQVTNQLRDPSQDKTLASICNCMQVCISPCSKTTKLTRHCVLDMDPGPTCNQSC